MKSASLYSESGAFLPRRCRHSHLWPVTLHKPRSSERFSPVLRRRPPRPGRKPAAPVIPVPPAVYRRPGTRLPRVRPGKPPYTARAPPPGNVPAPRRRAHHAAFVRLTRASLPAPGFLPQPGRKAPALCAPEAPAASPGTAPCLPRPGENRPRRARRGTSPSFRRARPTPAQPPPRAAAFCCAPKGGSNPWAVPAGDRGPLSREFSQNSGVGVLAPKQKKDRPEGRSLVVFLMAI